MKKFNKTFKYMAMAAAALPMSLSLLTSCSNDENEEILARSEVKFTTAISGAIESRADVAYTPSTGDITVYYKELGGAQKAVYEYAEGNGWESGKPLYWDELTPAADNTYTFYAVAPSAAYGAVKTDQSNAEDFVASDLLMARSAVTAMGTPVDFTLKHLMGKLVVNVLTTTDDNALTSGELTSTKVTIQGLKTVYTVTQGSTETVPATATVSGDANTGLIPNKNGNAYSYIAPAQPLSGMKLSFTVTYGDTPRTYVYEVPTTNAPSLAAGTITTFNITISKNKLTLGGVTVTDWATGTTTSATLAVAITGTADTPTGNTPAFSSMTLWVADEMLKNFSGATLGRAYGYDKGTDGTWSSNAPIYLDEMTAQSVIYATATNTDTNGDAIKDDFTGLVDYLVAGPVTAKGGAAAIQFRHGLAQMTVKLVAGTGFTSTLTDATITTPKMDQTAAMVTDDNGYLHFAARGVTFGTYNVESDATHLVVPQTLAKDAVFSVKLSNNQIYEAKLANDVTLEAGKNTTITLTLEETEAAIKAAVTPWGQAYAAAMVNLAGVTTGGNNWTPEETGELALAYVGGTSPYTASYSYAGGKWSSTAPLYWDEIPQTGYVNNAFAATFTPDNKPALFEKDILMGQGTTTAWGQDIELSLSHVMAKFSVALVEGTGMDDLDAEITGREIALQKSLSVEIGSDYKPGININTEVTKGTFVNDKAFYVAPQTLTDAHAITLTRPNGNTYTVKLSDLMDESLTNTLFTDGKVEAGKHYTISLIVTETGVAAKATIIDWEDEAGEADLALPVTPGTNDLTAIAEAGTLSLTYVDGNALSTNPSHQAKMNRDAEGNWTSASTLYWDEIAQNGYTGKFGALFVPDGWAVGDDFLYGLATADYGKNLNMTLKHAMSQLVITVKPGDQVTADEVVALTRTVTFRKMDASCTPNVSADGEASITLTDATAQSFMDGAVMTLPVQALTDAHVITLTRANGNKYTLKLSDMKDVTGNAVFPNGIEGGKKYSLVVTVNETALSVTATIQDWTPVNGSGNMTPDF